MRFFMVSVTIHSLTSRIFIDFLVSHQFGRLISDHPCGFGEYCWLHSLAIFQGHKMMKHFFERRTPSVFLLSGYLSCLNSVSVNILPIQGKITNFGKHKSQKFGQVDIWHGGLKWLCGFGVFCVPIFLLVSLQWVFSVRNNIFHETKSDGINFFVFRRRLCSECLEDGFT